MTFINRVRNKRMKYWKEDPIKIINSNNELKSNLLGHSLGFMVRDYTFYPTIKNINPDNIVNGNIKYLPSDMALHYSWIRHNIKKSIKICKKLNKKRKSNIMKVMKTRINSKYINDPKKYNISNQIIREDIIYTIKEILNINKDDINIWKINFETIIKYIELHHNIYHDNMEIEFLNTIKILIRYISNDKSYDVKYIKEIINKLESINMTLNFKRRI